MNTKISKYQIILVVFTAWLITSMGCSKPQSPIKISKLSCEYIVSPRGVETQIPRFSWQMTSEINGQQQRAYQIMLASNKKLLKKNKPDIWNTGKIKSSNNLNIEYKGSLLLAQEQYWWKVRVWDSKDRPSPWSDPNVFEMGLLSRGDWHGAQWIRLEQDPRKSTIKKRMVKTNGLAWFENDMSIHDQDKDPPVMRASHPAAYMRKEFILNKPVKRARLYICGLGYNEVYVNGSKIGDAVLDPGQTTYDKRSLYVIHDLTSVLKVGKNAIGVILGNGFYGQNIGFNAAFLDYGKPAMICYLLVQHPDGSRKTIISDLSWKATTGPIIFDNVYAGETYDAQQELPGWDQAGYNDKDWKDVVTVPYVTQKLTTQLIPPVKKIMYIKPKAMWKTSSGKVIYDIGQNIAGWARIKVHEPAGTIITLRFSEITTPDKQRLDISTIGTFATGVDQRDIYVCKGGGEEIWEPRFTYHGFRYVEVKGLSDPTLESLEACLVHTAVERTGTFECSDPLLNKIYTTSLWTIVDNLHSIPEDCPHREKCGWLGDAHTSIEVMNYNYDMSRMWIKFMKDIETTLGKGGMTYELKKATEGIPCNIAVGRRLCQEARPDWGSAIILIPWANYMFYGNKRILKDNYEHMVHWMSYLKSYLKDNILYQGYGDWCPPGGNKHMECPVALSSTAYYYHTLILMSKISNLLGHPENAKAYSEESEVIKDAFNRKFYNWYTKNYGSQTATSLALDFGLVPDTIAYETAQSLAEVEVMQEKQDHFSTGIHGAKRLYRQLFDYGFEKETFALLRNKDFPSYQYLFDHGFTTWPETFLNYETNADNIREGSHNHPMQAGFAVLFHESLGGIRPLETSPGFVEFEIKPHGVSFLQWLKCGYQSVNGDIESNWSITGDTLHLEVVIPVNTSAYVYVPAKDLKKVKLNQELPNNYNLVVNKGYQDGYVCFKVSSGKYNFESTFR